MPGKHELTTQNIFHKLSTQISIIKEKIKIENSVNDQGINTLMEGLVIQILNLSNGWKLVNANKEVRNTAAIDAIDLQNRILIQISSTSSKAKIKETIKKLKRTSYNHDFELYFFFLRGKQGLNRASRIELKKLLDNQLQFDIENNLLDFQSIHDDLYLSSEYDKSLQITELLDQIIGIDGPDSIKSNKILIGICFEGEIDKALLVSETLLDFGYGIVIESHDLLHEMKDNKNFESIYLAEDFGNLEFIEYYIIILNNKFIFKNLSGQKGGSKLFKSAISRYSRIEIVGFHKEVEWKEIKDEGFRHWQTITIENCRSKIEEILNDLVSNKILLAYDINKVRTNLSSIFPSHEVTTLSDTEHYTLFEFKMSFVGDSKFYYLVFDHNYNLRGVLDHFETNYEHLNKKQLGVLIPRDPYQRTEARLENVKNSFQVKSVYFVDDFFYQRSFKVLQEKIDSIDDFIEPDFYENGTSKIGLNGVVSWIINSGGTIGLLKGAGGVGKTTVSEIIYNRLIPSKDNKSNLYVILIDSLELVEHFQKVDFSDEREYDVYKFYVIWYHLRERVDPLINKSSFDFQFGLGNILIIFDGLDEIISSVPSFTLHSFLKNIRKLNIGRGKILIVCRDQYIDDIQEYLESKEGKFTSFQLLPFNEELASQYFNKHFPENSQKVKKAHKILQESVLPSKKSEYVYPPFVLQVVRQQVEREIEIDLGFESEILDQNDPNDYIIYRICARECAKKDLNGFELSVDDQLRFFMYMAIEEEELLIDLLNEYLENIGIKDRAIDIAKGLFDHPILIRKDSSLVFRYDFLKSYLKSLKILRIITSGEKPSVMALKVISSDLKLSSMVVKYLKDKLKKYDYDKLTSLFKDTIFRIVSGQALDNTCEKAISNLIVMRLSMLGGGLSATAYTKLLEKLLHHENGAYHNLYLINISPDFDLKLDFSNMIFTNSKIENFHNFIQCKFSRTTFFDENCEINKITSNVLITSKLSMGAHNFDSNIKGDNSIHKILSTKDSSGQNLSDRTKILKALRDYFKNFRDIRNYTAKPNTKTLLNQISKYDTNESLLKIHDLLMKCKIIASDGSDLKINSKLERDVMLFMDQGLMFRELNEIIKKILDTLEKDTI